MMRWTMLALGATASTTLGAEVVVLSSGHEATDTLLISVLEDAGHAVTLGPEYWELTAKDVIGEFDVVYLQINYNWAFGDMPVEGQEKILDFVALGGGIVTCEWATWNAWSGELQTIEPILPSTSDGSFVNVSPTTYTIATPDPVLNKGLPDSFSFPNANIGGSEANLTPKRGATVFYTSDQSPHGVIGWEAGGERVISLSTLAGVQSLADDDFATLLANAMTWAAGTGNECLADCNDDLVLNILDFVCFQTLFQNGDDAADVNGDGVLNILDFVAFQALFQAGCV